MKERVEAKGTSESEGSDADEDSSANSSDDDHSVDEAIDEATNGFQRLVSRLAILGDSPVSLGLSFVLLLLSAGVSFWLDRYGSLQGAAPDPYEKLGPVPTVDPPQIFTIDIRETNGPLITDTLREAYRRDGVIAVRGLVDEALLKRLDVEAAAIVEEQVQKNDGKKRKGNQFHTVDHGTIFRNPPYVREETEGATLQNTTAFLELALLSAVPRVAAELMSVEQASGYETIRLLRDIFLAKDDDPYICGWHVDDLGFWPARPEAVGVNAWITLDDLDNLERGGGFALAVGSHDAPWRDEAHYATGASTTFPREGYRNASDLIERRTGSGTCNLKQSAPHLHRRMEETKRIYAVQRGDVIFHTRWLFHRTVPYNKSNALESDRSDPTRGPIFRRYSLRFGPGTAIIPPGYGTELSVLWDDRNGGRTSDAVCDLDGPWYPQVWPSVSVAELGQTAQLVQDKLPKAASIRDARRKEMKPLLRRLAKEQYRPAL